MKRMNSSKHTPSSFTLSLLLGAGTVLGGAAGCPATGEGEGEGETEDPAAEACEHMAEGPANAVTAGADLASSPDVSAAHTRHDIALVDLDGAGAGTYLGGSAAYAVVEAGDHTIFLDVDVPLTLVSSSGDAIAIEATAAVDTCADVAVAHTVELPIGTVELRFGPTTTTTVRAVIESTGSHDDE